MCTTSSVDSYLFNVYVDKLFYELLTLCLSFRNYYSACFFCTSSLLYSFIFSYAFTNTWNAYLTRGSEHLSGCKAWAILRNLELTSVNLHVSGLTSKITKQLFDFKESKRYTYAPFYSSVDGFDKANLHSLPNYKMTEECRSLLFEQRVDG